MTAFPSGDKSTFRRTLLESKRVIEVPKKRVPFTKRLASIFAFFSLKKVFRHQFFRSKKRVILTSLVIVFILLGGSVFVVYEYAIHNNPAIIYAKKVQSMTTQVSKYVSLPSDEKPVIATVTDVKKLPHEKFFSYAQDGDKILMYKKHKKAILYRPSTKQVITEATLDFRNTQPKPVPNQQAVAGASTSAQPTVTVNPYLPTPTPQPYHPQGKILVMPQQ